jgi:glycosyltransferase involved in cell wall biosynthesis
MPKSRIDRLLHTSNKIYEKALGIKAEIYHFHDPELIFIGHKLRKKDKKIIYDVHEDVPRQILAKPYIFRPIRKIISILTEVIENHFSRKFDAIICATPHINERFLKINPKSFNISNFPILKEFETINKKWNERKNSICYIGGITRERGILELVEALGYSDCQLSLAGAFDSEEIFNLAKENENWKKVKYYGQVDRQKIVEILSSSKIGMVTLRLTPNHLESLPIKMFEYMAAEIPVITSNFPVWKKIVESNNYGLCVNPMDPEEIGKAINRLLNNADEAKTMGENGRKAVIERFNWERESEKLILIYKTLI